MKKTTKIISKSVMALLLAAGLVSAGGSAQADSFALGNCSENILNGGVIDRTNDGDVYYADTENGDRLCVMNEDDSVTVLSDNACSYINVIDDTVYYVTDQGKTVMSLDRGTGEEAVLFTVEDGISEMYVTSEGEVYYLSGGDVYERALPETDETETSAEADEAEEAEEAEPEEKAEAEDTEITDAEESAADDNDAAEPAVTEEAVSDDEAAGETAAEEAVSEEAAAEESVEEVSETEENVTDPVENVTEEQAVEEASSEEETVSEEEEFAPIESESGKIVHFIPTAYGLIYATGKTLSYDLYADGDVIAEDVSTFYDADGYLIMNCEGDDRQAQISALFGGDAAAQVEEYSLGSSLDASGDSEEEDGECEECELNAELAEDAEVEDDWDLGEKTWELLTDSDGESDEDVNLDASCATATTSILYDSSVSESQRNMVRRAYQMHLIEWTPRKDIAGWNSEYTFEAGTTYTGLPYGQPVNVGGYVPWSHSLEEFAAAVADSSSKMYTSYSSYNKRAPYYSTDCSGFVSWAWNLSHRTWTSAFHNYCNEVANQSIYSVEIGDAFCKAGSHVCMVSDIGYNDGKIVYIDIIEQTPPSTKLTRYGEGGKKTLAQMSAKYLDKGYILYRSKTRDSVTYTPSSAVLVDGESAGDVKLDTTSLQLNIGETYSMTYESDASGVVYWVSSDTSVVTVDSSGKLTGVGAGEAEVTLHVGPVKASASVTVMPAKVTLTSATATITGGITITWNEVPGTSYYIVFRKNSAGTWSALKTVSDALTYTDSSSDLKNYTKYTYTVRAYYKMSDGTLLKGTYDATGISATTVTATPQPLSLTVKDYQSMVFTWSPVEGAEGYRVYKRTAGTTFKYAATVTDGTSYEFSGLTLGTAYAFTVRAYFTEDEKTVLSSFTAGLAKYCVPATPVLTEITVASNTSQVVHWNAVEKAESYRVYRKSGTSKNWSTIGTTTDTSFTSTGLSVGTTYYYTVRACVSVNNKDYYSDYDTTGISKICCTATPVLKSVRTTGTGKQTVTWSAVSGATGYILYCKAPGDSNWKVAGKTTAASLQVSGKSVGTSYTYTVRAYTYLSKTKVNIYSGFDANGISAICLPDVPVLQSITAVTPTSQKLSWNAVEGAEGYYVYRKAADSANWKRVATTSETSYLSEGLTAGTSYSYTVRAYITVNGTEMYGGFDASGLSKICCPATPVLSGIEASSYTSQRITWEAVEGAEKYRIYVKAGTSTRWSTLAVTENTYWLATKLTCGTKYTYTVRAIVMSGESEVLSGFDTAGIGKVCMPAEPVLTSAAIAGYGKITVSWQSVSGANYYYVYRKTASSGWKYVGYSKGLTYTDSGLALNTEYIYTVRAVRKVGTSSVLSGFDTTGVSCMMALAAPVLESAVSESAGTVTVSWQSVEGAESYRVYYQNDEGSWKQLTTVAADQTSATISNVLESGKTYTFTVRAFWAYGTSLKGGSFDADGVSCEIQ